MESHAQIEMLYLKKCHRHCHLRHAHRTANTLPPLSSFGFLTVALAVALPRCKPGVKLIARLQHVGQSFSLPNKVCQSEAQTQLLELDHAQGPVFDPCRRSRY